MNILAFDPDNDVGHFVRSILGPQGHRVSISSVVDDARLKLDTGLFDAVVIGPTGAPKELADYLEMEFPQIPVVIAGAAVEIPPAGQVVAVISAPISARRLMSAFQKLASRRAEQIGRLPVEVAAEGIHVSCRLADLTPETMILSGESDEFARHIGAGAPHIEAKVMDMLVQGEVTSVESPSGEFARTRRVSVRVEGDGARSVLLKLLK